jgi:hypothetical protein
MKIGEFERFCFDASAPHIYSLGVILFEMINLNTPFGQIDSGSTTLPRGHYRARHYRPTISRGDTTASDFTARDTTAISILNFVQIGHCVAITLL